MYRFLSSKCFCTISIGFFLFLTTIAQAKTHLHQRRFLKTTTQHRSLQNKYQVGVASWYGGRDRGKLTASGIRFNPDALVAAHATLPLPTVVRVTNLSNGRSVEVFVIDRMPKKRGRIIDLSQSVAKKLGFMRKGLTPVQIEVISRPPMKFVRASLKSSTKTHRQKLSTLRKKNATEKSRVL
ncbi:MAG: septal ring lytic transglycosylase RlpA family protein [Holosporales bacterium]|nr:septal ring lytic transglycosylase RlpA family protein [Holosporales bacterium]